MTPVNHWWKGEVENVVRSRFAVHAVWARRKVGFELLDYEDVAKL